MCVTVNGVTTAVKGHRPGAPPETAANPSQVDPDRVMRGVEGERRGMKLPEALTAWSGHRPRLQREHRQLPAALNGVTGKDKVPAMATRSARNSWIQMFRYVNSIRIDEQLDPK